MIEASPKAKIHIQLARNTVQKWSESSPANEEDVPYEARQRIPHQTLVVIGGFQAESQENAKPVDHLEFYNINSNSWSTVNQIFPVPILKIKFVYIFQNQNWNFPHPRGYFSVEMINNHLYVIGGNSADETLKSCQKLDLLTGKWSEAPPMTRNRWVPLKFLIFVQNLIF